MKVLAIASAGGHWVQLLRLLPAIEGEEIIFASTKACFSEMVKGYRFCHVPDANRWNKLKLIYMGIMIIMLVISNRPKIVITTGAAPGLMGIIAGRIIGSKTIWIDSIANVEKLSMSGKIALYFAHKVFTQWPHLESERILYKGDVL